MSMSHGYEFKPLIWQSQHISFADWVTLATLCLAPLIAHVLGGVPKITNLTRALSDSNARDHSKDSSEPRWHDSMCLYNPTSILWRYWAIMDRCLRTRSWGPIDMACANTIFWTEHRFDGSEDRARTSRALCTVAPAHKRMRVLSVASATTLVITLQGAGFVYSFVTSLLGDSNWANELAVDAIFSPLAFLGLLRLAAALWLNDDYRFSVDAHDPLGLPVPLEGASKMKRAANHRPDPDSIRLLPIAETSTYAYPSSHAARPSSSTLEPISKWYSRLLRFIYVIPILCLWGTLISMIAPRPNGIQILTATDMVLIAFYLLFLGVSVLILAYYFIVRERLCTTTVLPCIGRTWYKIYTVVLVLLMLVMIIVAAIETREVGCGKWTTLPVDSGLDVCNFCPSNLIDSLGLNCTNGTKSRRSCHLASRVALEIVDMTRGNRLESMDKPLIRH